MNENILFAIFKQIVADMGYQPGFQINTFAVVDGPFDLGHESLGYSFKDYQDGFFWSRFWVGQGANPDKIKADFPVLFVEPTDASQECANDQDYQQRFTFVVIDKIPCDHCPQNFNRTGRSVSQALRDILRRYMAELYTYGLYNVEESGDFSELWASEGRAAWLATQPNTSVMGPTDVLHAGIVDTELNILEVGTWADFRGQRVSINFHLCNPVEINFNYNTPLIDPAAINIPCATC